MTAGGAIHFNADYTTIHSAYHAHTRSVAAAPMQKKAISSVLSSIIISDIKQ
jgi:hypothetical protein